MIRQQDLSSAGGDQVELRAADEALQTRQSRIGRHNIETFLINPEAAELRIINKHIRHTGSVAAVFEIHPASIQEQRRPVRIKKHRRERVVMAVNDQFSFWRSQECFGKMPRGQKQIKSDHSQTSGLEEQNHHKSGSKKSALATQNHCSDSSNTEDQRGHAKRKTKVGKRLQR